MINRIFLSSALAVVCAAGNPASAEDGTFDSGGVTIRYVSEGEGVPVLLIHGWMADSSMWGRGPDGNTKLKPSAGFRVIALDCRGHGKSGAPHDPAQYGPEMAEDLVRLLDHLKIEKAHLVGYSSGAYLAGYVAAHHPERVLSLVYASQAPLLKAQKVADPADASDAAGPPTDAATPVAPPPAAPGVDKKPAQTPHNQPRAKTDPAPAEETSEVEVFARAVDEGADLGVYIIAVTPPDRPKPSPERARLIAEYLFRGKDLKALAAAGRGFKHLGVSLDALKKCHVPTLFIHGTNELESLKAHVASVHEQLGHGELKLIAGGDHMTTLIIPEFAKSVEQFLRTGSTK
ncbi:MAG: alpha/beta fold hydrolase [Phycisphaerales bacterium]